MKLRAVLAANLRLLRSDRKLSQDHLAEAAGLTRNYVGSLEREEYAASVDALERLAAALKVQPGQLLERAARPNRPREQGRVSNRARGQVGAPSGTISLSHNQPARDRPPLRGARKQLRHG